MKQAVEQQSYNREGSIPEGVFFYAICDLDGYKKYKVACKECREDVAEVYARDRGLSDWRRVRYISWHDDKYWRGARGVNIKDDILRFECSCQPEVRKTINNFSVKEAK